jgi:hypothetical protein
MKRNRKNNSNNLTRMELKYCEHCGSLWLRPSGAETVYCDACQPKVAELPPTKKNPGRLLLPTAKTALIERYGDVDEEFIETDSELDFDAVGGVA